MNITYDRLFIGGEWAAPSSTATITVTSASTEEVIGAVPQAQPADVDAAVAAARRAFDDPQGWSRWEPERRAAAMESLAAQLELRNGEMARRVSSQNGLPISIAGQLEGGFPLTVLRYYADLIKNASTEESRPHLFGGTTTVLREPMGVAAAIAPFNFPQTLASLKHGPALAAGCTMVLKPSPETVLDAFLFAEAVAASDIPPGVVNLVTGGGDIGACLVSHPGIDRVGFTGSTPAGRHIAEACGRLLRPVSLELGGKSAAIVLDDADLDLANIGEELYGAILLNAGQTCYLGTRVLAPRSRYAEVIDILAAFVSSLPVGDALDPKTLVGPMVSEAHRARVERLHRREPTPGRIRRTSNCQSPVLSYPG
ncbi:aldehyde dehydrogenase family protein [Streptomyces tuirus]|uniref:Aldehyde dehydrogenase family protein n=1 Tax=Streptomyces tuirus TaxID=68278 RepID=A0A941FB22_9ACTN|nr:aldehyde dehydrogenase family protein [Streptomyces tuirus]